MSTILYTFRRCPYAIRARMALFAGELNFEIREVVLKNKPPQMLEVSPKGTVPILVHDNDVIEESLEIMQWALENSPVNWLNFAENIQKEIYELISTNDQDFKHHLDRYKYPQRYGVNDTSIHFSECCKFLDVLQKKLAYHRFLFADSLSLADVAIFPFVRQFSKVDKQAFENLPLEKMKKWLEYHEQSELFQSVMTKYTPWHQESNPVFRNNT
ncbi:glutathione S-transferase [Candidatus Uabimicrobium sp. HlEnr_7]|uniref:glutathione S-transferase n=1 Tax=Candidatus Uabimicrobium helgolandensis TaxID=3095367 RepID=UPI003555DF2F